MGPYPPDVRVLGRLPLLGRDAGEDRPVGGPVRQRVPSTRPSQAHLKHRLASLDDDVPGLSFGRLDGDDDETWYIGRRHVEGVLVIGPNPIFLRYIAQVLPSLGETAARQTTLDRLLAGTSYRPAGADADEPAALKGDARMASVIATAVARSVRRPDDDVAVTTQWGTARIGRDAVAEVMAAVRERAVPHNVGRTAFRTQMARRVRRDLLRRRSPEVVTTEAVDAELRADRAWGRTLDRLWPQLGVPALVRRLLTSLAALAAAAKGVLAADEQSAIRRPATRRIGDEPWTAADLALLASTVIDAPRARRASARRPMADRSCASSTTMWP